MRALFTSSLTFMTLLSACTTVTVTPAPEQSVVNAVTLCSAGITTKTGISVSAAAKKSVELNGYEGSITAAFLREAEGTIAKSMTNDTEKVAMLKVYNECLINNKVKP